MHDALAAAGTGVTGICGSGIIEVIAELYLAGVIPGLLIGLAQKAPDIIGAIGKMEAPSIDLLVLNTTDPVKWADSKDFRLTSVGLNDSLQMGGDPCFAG